MTGEITGDAKFVKPGSGMSLEVSEANTLYCDDQMYELARTATGKRITYGLANDITRGRFQLDETSDDDDEALSPFFDEFWEALEAMVVQILITGTGFMIVFDEGEILDDIAEELPYNPRKDGGYRFVVPETQYMSAAGTTRSSPVLDVRDYASQWQWWSRNVHASRLLALQFRPNEAQPLRALGELEPVRIALWGLHNLGMGVLERITPWAMRKLLFRVDPSRPGILDKDKLEKIRDAQRQEDYNIVGPNDEIVQIENAQGQGAELETILYHTVSVSTEIPAQLLMGNREGAVTGSEADLTAYGQLLTKIQAKLTPFVKRVLVKFYGWARKELASLSWNVDFFKSERTKLELESMRLMNENLEKNQAQASRSPAPGEPPGDEPPAATGEEAAEGIEA